MSALFEIKEERERVILLGVQVSDNDDTMESLAELKELAKTAGAETLDIIVQNRESVHPGTYIGKGKIEEVGMRVAELDATGVICDDELSPAQLKNLEAALQCKVMDRTMLILDIFAQHAVTREGKIQVELAQLKYRQSRLVGMHASLSRLGGGIGTRGPGEKKLEIDRRLIRDRIANLNRELAEVKKNREVARALRSKNLIPVAAIVGYTNAGKSTLLNHLTNAGVLEENMLFATLDPTTRNLELESGEQLLLTDTVGFIRKLPHHLIDAFRSTLEEAKYSDFILHIVDASNEEAEKQMYVVYETLRQLEVKDKPIITVFNKKDLITSERIIKDLKADASVWISAKTGDGVEKLLETISDLLKEQKMLVEKVFSYAEAGKIQQIRKYGQLLEEEYREDGIFVRAYVPKEVFYAIEK
ncbi:MAG: GTPase HflX [Lachnospiraceae bacterium]|nr:GTPase HflX [Lachnospiraceae bacterium]